MSEISIHVIPMDTPPLGYCDQCGKIMVLLPKYAKRFEYKPTGSDQSKTLHHCNSCADFFMFDYDKSWREK